MEPSLAVLADHPRGLSYGAEGGGSNLAAEAGQSLFRRVSHERADLDAAMFWTLQNLGVGNIAQIKLARSNLASANLELVGRHEQCPQRGCRAHGRIRARLVQIDICEEAVKPITRLRWKIFAVSAAAEGLPIELMNSLRLLCEARLAYLDAIMDYNQAQMELYVALGQPPANTLARPVRAEVKNGGEPMGRIASAHHSICAACWLMPGAGRCDPPVGAKVQVIDLARR